MVNEQALLEDLVSAIQSWMQGNRNRSLSGLARRTNVAYSTIRRIAQNESVPHPYTALSIAEIVLPTQQRLEFVKKHFPLVGNLMDECYDQKNIDPQNSDESLNRYLYLEPHNRIFNIAATQAGTTRSAILALCGQSGLDALEEMMNSGILVEGPDQTIRYHKNNWVKADVDYLLHQVRLSTQHFDKQLIGSLGANIMHSTGAIRSEKLPELKQLIMNFTRDVNKLKDEPDAEGGIHFFVDLMYSLYDRSEYPKDLEKH